MTVTSSDPVSNLGVRYGNPMFDCDGAKVRAQCRHLATVVTISGDIDDMNVDRLSQYIRRFTLPEKPLVLDLSQVNYLSAQSVSLLYTVDDDCSTAGVEWLLVPCEPVDDLASLPIAGSVPEALHHFADVIDARRQLLPLLSKTA
jgi:anti-anti-sigma factor